MKKIVFGILGIVVLASLYSVKKVTDLINISNQLQFKLFGFPSVNISAKTIKVSVNVTNPTTYDLEAKYLHIKNIRLVLPGKKPFAYSVTEITNISIAANSDYIVKNIIFKVHIGIIQVLQLIKDFKSIKVIADVSAFGQSISITK